MISKVVFPLAEKFNRYNWDVILDNQIKGYIIFVDDYDFYRSKELAKWKKIYRKKFPKIKIVFACKNLKIK